MVLYEYPLNEGIRTMLRLEHLFDRLGQLMVRETALDHHFALVTLFEIVDVASRADLKADLLRDLEQQKSRLANYRGMPGLDEAALDATVGRIDHAFTRLNEHEGKAGADLTTNEWLMSIRSRVSIPGGTCEFDLPAYYAWQKQPVTQRRTDLLGWTTTMMPLAEALNVLLGLLRDTGTPHMVSAPSGQYQQSLPPGRAFLLMRVRLPDNSLVPEISGHRLMASVRLMKPEAEGRLHPYNGDASFELTLCG